MVGATGDMAIGEKLSLSLYMFRYYLLYLYEVQPMTLYSVVIDVDSNFRTLFDCQDQISTFIFFVIFSTYAFPNDKNAIEFIRSLSNAQDKQRTQQKIAKSCIKGKNIKKSNMKSGIHFLYMKKLGMIWANQ